MCRLCEIGASGPQGADEALMQKRAAAAAQQITYIAVLSKGFPTLSGDGSQAGLRGTFSRASQLT